jgi:glycosyltransferase involved in cell wall biosynthesis
VMTEAYPNVRIFYDVWPTETVRTFYEKAHVLLAPSRGEGKNMPALEFMSTGGTVIATNWAGHTQWLDPSYSYPLDYTLMRAVPDHRTDAENARADVEHMKRLLLHCFENRDEVRRKGDLASQVVPLAHSWDRVLDRLMNKLHESLPKEKGERLWVLDSAAAPRRPRDE